METTTDSQNENSKTLIMYKNRIIQRILQSINGFDNARRTAFDNPITHTHDRQNNDFLIRFLSQRKLEGEMANIPFFVLFIEICFDFSEI